MHSHVIIIVNHYKWSLLLCWHIISCILEQPSVVNSAANESILAPLSKQTQSFHPSPLPVQFCLSCSACLPTVLPVLSFRFCPGYLILAVLLWQPCLTVLSKQLYSVSPFCLSILSCPVLHVLFHLYCSICTILPVLLCWACSVILFCLSCSDFLILPVLFCLSYSAFLVLVLPTLTPAREMAVCPSSQ